ncbi:MAG: hypothetical protein APR55_05095 [Methanolinea sp. SDB]|jgi:hypothetical protein|nr:MAG: hypothetical protein APR55_05095 [Methanolinea sp. SDB]
MDYHRILQGPEDDKEIYDDIVRALEDVELFPDLVEPIYRKAMNLDDDRLDRLRFALLRVQLYSDIHRNEDMERAQKMKYVAEVLEKTIFGSLMLEHEELGSG